MTEGKEEGRIRSTIDSDPKRLDFFRHGGAGLWESGFPKLKPGSAWFTRSLRVMSDSVLQP